MRFTQHVCSPSRWAATTAVDASPTCYLVGALGGSMVHVPILTVKALGGLTTHIPLDGESATLLSQHILWPQQERHMPLNIGQLRP